MKNKISIFIKYFLLLAVIVLLVALKLKHSFNAVEYYNLEGEVYYTKVNIGTYSGGNVVELPIKEGSVVKKGDLIVQLKNELLESKIKGYEQTINEGIPINRTDYLEQLKRFENLKIVSPVEGYILEVHTAENGYMKDSDIVAVAVPMDSIKYSLIVNKSFENKSPLELKEQFKIGQKVKVENTVTKTKIDATIVDSLPFIKEGEPGDIKTRFLIIPDSAQNMQDSLGQEIEILFVKKTMITRIIDQTNDLVNYIRSSIKK